MRATRGGPVVGTVGGLLCAFWYHQMGTWLSPAGGEGSPFALFAGLLFGIHPLVGYLVLGLVGAGLGLLTQFARATR